MLTATKIKNIKRRDKLYAITDGSGLSLEIPVKGSLRWRFRYRFDGKAKNKSLGIYPDVSLQKAREKRDIARADIANGINPFQKKVIQEQKDVVQKTFREWAEWYIKSMYDDHLSDSHIERTCQGFDKYVYPHIGDKAINDVLPKDIISILHKMKDKGVIESAKKVFSSIKRVYSKAMVNHPDEVIGNPASHITKISDVIGKSNTVSYPVITDPQELGTLLNTINNYGLEEKDPSDFPTRAHSSTRLSLMMIAHVFVRPSNVRLALWDEIDLQKKQWVIPGSKMKTGKELIVPLSTQVLDILEKAKEASPYSPLVFPSNRSKSSPMSDAAMVGALRRMGYDRSEIVAHSFRGIFSTIAHEKSDFKHDVIEIQLAHSVGSAVSQAYNRAQHLEERTKMMQWYSDLLEGYQNGDSNEYR